LNAWVDLAVSRMAAAAAIEVRSSALRENFMVIPVT
jgi:hypothetical protein